MQNVYFLNNVALNPACFIDSYCTSYLSCLNCYFQNNTLYQQNVYIPTNTSFHNSPSDLLLNQASYGMVCGRSDTSIAHNYITSVQLSSNQFINNTGILINIQYKQNITAILVNLTFISNSVSDFALILNNDNNKLILNSSQFSNNYGHFGMIIISGSSSLYQGCQNIFTSNQGYHASILYFDSAQGVFSETNSTLGSNIISPLYPNFGDGITPQASPIYIYQSQIISFESCNFLNATEYSGIFVAISSVVIFNSSYFSGNIGFGTVGMGVIINTADILIINCNIEKYNFLDKSLIKSNIASLNPSFIYSIFSKIKIINSNISNIIVSPMSNIIDLLAGTLNIENCSFSNLSGFDDKSYLINAISCSIWIDSSTFLKNAQIIKAASNTTISLQRVIFLQNTGGKTNKFIIQIIESSLFATNCYLEDDGKIFKNSAFINILNSNLTISRTNITNFAGSTGALILVQSSAFMEVTDLLISNISFITSGGILQATNLNYGLISNCNFGIAQCNGGYINIVGTTSTSNITIDSNTFKTSNLYPIIIIQNGWLINLINCIINSYDIVSVDQNLNYPDNIILIQNFNQTFVYNTSFNNLISKFGSLSIGLFNDSISNIENCFFESNFAFGGSAISIISSGNSKFKISNSSFVNNRAFYLSTLTYQSGFGGSIYLICSNEAVCLYNIVASIFQNNTADIGGGAIYFDKYPPNIDSTTVFKGNNALYGKDLGAYPVKIVFWNSTYQQNISYDWANNYLNLIKEQSNTLIFNLTSGAQTQDFGFALVDIYGQIILSDNSSKLHFEYFGENSTDFFTIPTEFTPVAGIFNVKLKTISFAPDEIIISYIISDAIKSLPNLLDQNFSNNNNYSIILNFRNCTLGEIVSQKQCEKCPTGFYNLDLNNNSIVACLPCDPNIQICQGGDQLIPRSGYWRLNKTATLFLKCENINACIGADNFSLNTNLSLTGACADGYKNNLCDTCDFGKAKFGSESICVDCSIEALYYLKMIGVIFGQGLIIFITVKSTLTQPINKEKEQQQILKSNFMKILINYTQIISLASNFKIRWPDSSKALFQASSQVSFAISEIFSVECFLALGEKHYGISIFLIKYIIISLVPFIIFLNWVVCYGSATLFENIKKAKAIRQQKIFEKPESKSITIILVIIVFLQPNMLKFFLMLFICNNLYREDNPEYYLTSDYSLQCWDNNHLKYALGIGIPNIIIWGLVIPFILYQILKIYKYHLNEQSVQKRYSFIYKGYKTEKYFWEIIIMFRKFWLVLSAVFLGDISPMLQTLVCYTIIMIAAYYQIKHKPFNSEICNDLEMKSLIGSGIVILLGIYFIGVSETYEFFDYVAIIILIGANVYFFISWIIEYVKVMKSTIVEILQKIKQKLNLTKNNKNVKDSKFEKVFTSPSETVINNLNVLSVIPNKLLKDSDQSYYFKNKNIDISINDSNVLFKQNIKKKTLENEEFESSNDKLLKENIILNNSNSHISSENSNKLFEELDQSNFSPIQKLDFSINDSNFLLEQKLLVLKNVELNSSNDKLPKENIMLNNSNSNLSLENQNKLVEESDKLNISKIKKRDFSINDSNFLLDEDIQMNKLESEHLDFKLSNDSLPKNSFFEIIKTITPIDDDLITTENKNVTEITDVNLIKERCNNINPIYSRLSRFKSLKTRILNFPQK